MKQEVSNMFKSHGLKITIEANKKIGQPFRCDLRPHKWILQTIHEVKQQVIVCTPLEQPSTFIAKKHPR